jgi:putative flippase GtrA
MGFELAVTVSYILGMLCAYVLARILVFRGAKTTVGRGLVRFVIVNIGSFCLVFTVTMLMRRLLLPALSITENQELISHVIGLGSSAIPSYFGHKRFTFNLNG